MVAGIKPKMIRSSSSRPPQLCGQRRSAVVTIKGPKNLGGTIKCLWEPSRLYNLEVKMSVKWQTLLLKGTDSLFT